MSLSLRSMSTALQCRSLSPNGFFLSWRLHLQPTCTDLLTQCSYCHTGTEVVDQPCYLTLSQYSDTGPTSLGTDPISLFCHGRPRLGSEPRAPCTRGGCLTNQANDNKLKKEKKKKNGTTLVLTELPVSPAPPPPPTPTQHTRARARAHTHTHTHTRTHTRASNIRT